MDIASKKIEWHRVVFPGVHSYTDLCPGGAGLVYGITDRKRFFVFDPAARKIVHVEETGAAFGPTNSQQGPRVLLPGPDGVVYLLFVKGIARVEPGTFKITLLAEAPVPIGPGGDLLDGRIYFGSGSHMYSWKIK